MQSTALYIDHFVLYYEYLIYIYRIIHGYFRNDRYNGLQLFIMHKGTLVVSFSRTLGNPPTPRSRLVGLVHN
jgi:hypothetical protein